MKLLILGFSFLRVWKVSTDLMKKDNSKFWCKFCRIFIYDNKISRANHDKQAAHKSNVERFIRDIEQKKTQELKNTNMAKRLLGIPITEKESYSPSSSMYIPVAADLKNDYYQNPASSATFKETKSSVGEVGEWQVVQVDEPVKPNVQEETISHNDASREETFFNESRKDQDVKNKILEFSRSVLHSPDHNDTISVKEAVVESEGGDVSIKKRVFKGNLKKNFIKKK